MMRERCTFHRQGDPRVCGGLRSEHPAGGQRKPIGAHVWRHDRSDEWRLDIAFRVAIYDPPLPARLPSAPETDPSQVER